ncbi:sensor histidine kinase [Microbulbifer sp. SSSA002]|uniref:sensor histidine kinase n=1 Tax=unclassified Microbulbifer TaxID=2619833 RepID=UPI00403A2CDB
MQKAATIILTLCFSILVVLYSAFLKAAPGNPIVVHYDAPFWIALQCFFSQWLTLKAYKAIVSKQENTAIPAKKCIKVFILSCSFYLFASIALTLFLEFAFGLQVIDGRHVLLLSISLLMLHALNSGAVIAFQLVEGINARQLDLERVQKLLLEKQLEVMQQKLDPHFLFNNLNILSALIASRPEEADEFLDRFTNIYRYILDGHNCKTISLERELAFADDYMSLLTQRFSNAYKLDIQCGETVRSQYATLPCSLQLALENVVKHNQGDKENPLSIKVEIVDRWLEVSNKIRPKVTGSLSQKVGLSNLKVRSEAILGRSVEVIKRDGDFMLRLPLIGN